MLSFIVQTFSSVSSALSRARQCDWTRAQWSMRPAWGPSRSNLCACGSFLDNRPETGVCGIKLKSKLINKFQKKRGGKEEIEPWVRVSPLNIALGMARDIFFTVKLINSIKNYYRKWSTQDGTWISTFFNFRYRTKKTHRDRVTAEFRSLCRSRRTGWVSWFLDHLLNFASLINGRFSTVVYVFFFVRPIGMSLTVLLAGAPGPYNRSLHVTREVHDSYWIS